MQSEADAGAQSLAAMRAKGGGKSEPFPKGREFSKAGAFWRNLSVWLLAFTFLIAWLPFVRSIVDGASYEWGVQIFSWRLGGAGMGGDFWFVAGQAALALVVVYSGFRAGGRLFYALALLWSALMAAHYLTGLVAAPGAMIFRGDTLGVEVDIGLAAFGVYAAAFLAALTGARMEYARGMRPPRFPWTPVNTVIFGVALVIAPFQYWFLRAGEPHGRTDEWGVVLTMVQWLVLVLAFASNRRQAV